MGDFDACTALTAYATLCAEWTSRDMDVLTAVDSIKGMGKTSFSIQAARHYLRAKFGLPLKETVESFDPKKYIAYSFSDISRLVDELEDGAPMIIDEAVNVMMGEDWMKRENKDLKKVFTKMRTRHLCVFANIPDFWWMDAKYRENMVTFWTHVYQRGWTALSFPQLVPGIKDRWYRDYFLKSNIRISYLTPKEIPEGLFRKYPCYQDIIYYPKVPDPIYTKYRELRDEHTKASGGLQIVGMSPSDLARIVARAVYYKNISRAAIEEGLKPRILSRLLTKVGVYDMTAGGWTEKADKLYEIFNKTPVELEKIRKLGQQGTHYIGPSIKIVPLDAQPDDHHEEEHEEGPEEEPTDELTHAEPSGEAPRS